MRHDLLDERAQGEGVWRADAALRLKLQQWERFLVDDNPIAPMPPPPAVWTAIERRIDADTKVFALHRDAATPHRSG